MKKNATYRYVHAHGAMCSMDRIQISLVMAEQHHADLKRLERDGTH